MAINAKEISQFKKLMMMTTSDNDPEALIAIRKANTILKNNKVNWDEVCGQLVFTSVGKSSHKFSDKQRPKSNWQTGRTTSPSILGPLQFAMNRSDGSFYDFLESLKFQFESKGWLSEAQVAAIMKSAERHGWL